MVFKKTKKKKTRIGEDDDITRKLPDELISRILSSMPTKFAVRTSVLSTRWRYLWTSITNLDIDAEGCRFYSDLQLSSFIDFVDRAFRLCSSSRIQLFRLKCVGGWNLKESVERWIGEAIKRNPTEIIIDLYPIIIPLSVFTCKTLTTLKVDDFLSRGGIPSYVDLPNLKVASVGSIDEELLRILINRCPLLEDLSFSSIFVSLESRHVFEIRSPGLKKLIFSGYVNDHMFKIVLHTPNLEYLYIPTDLNFDIQNLKSLLEATLLLDYYNADGDEQVEDEDRRRRRRRDQLVKLLKEISGVKSLSLHFYGPDYMEAEEVLRGVKLPTFPNLVSLKMVFATYSNCKFLPQFLESSPNLKVLSLEMDPRYKDDCFDVNFESGCSLLHLEEINLKVFEGNKDDHAVLEYLLRNAVVLKQLKVVVVELTIEREKEFYNELVKLKQAAARNYGVEFHGDHVHLSSIGF